jgi:hypothetical protein
LRYSFGKEKPPCLDLPRRNYGTDLETRGRSCCSHRLRAFLIARRKPVRILVNIDIHYGAMQNLVCTNGGGQLRGSHRQRIGLYALRGVRSRRPAD